MVKGRCKRSWQSKTRKGCRCSLRGRAANQYEFILQNSFQLLLLSSHYKYVAERPCRQWLGTLHYKEVYCMMLLQPGFDGRNLAVGEQINGLTALQITDQRAVAESALVCPVVQANDARRGLGGVWTSGRPTTNSSATPTGCLFPTLVRPSPAS